MTNKLIISKGSEENDDNAIPPKLIVFGNPLLDMSVEITDNTILKEFNLNSDDQKEVSIEKLTKLTAHVIENYSTIEYNPGGSALNTCRILCGLKEKNVLFCGSIGKDDNANKLKDILTQASLNFWLQENNEYHTGSCICLINGKHRSLVANIGAALLFKKENIIKNSILLNFNKESLKPKIFYIEGFFIPKKIDVCKIIYKNFCKNTINIFATNLSAPYIIKNYDSDVKYMVERADIIFGNKNELNELTNVYKFSTINQTIERLMKKFTYKNKHKIIIITDSDNEVLTFIGNYKNYNSNTYKVPKIKKEKIIDTTGAGDSFVAGFLNAYMRHNNIDECIRFGCEIAAKVITQIGCNLPE